MLGQSRLLNQKGVCSLENAEHSGIRDEYVYRICIYIYIKMHEFRIIGSNINVGMGQNWVITTIEWFI